MDRDGCHGRGEMRWPPEWSSREVESANCCGLARVREKKQVGTTPPFQVAIEGLVGRGKKLHDVHQRNNLWRVVEEGNVTTEDWVGGELGRKGGRLVEKWTVDRVQGKKG